jgi:TolA-binding protein
MPRLAFAKMTQNPIFRPSVGKRRLTPARRTAKLNTIKRNKSLLEVSGMRFERHLLSIAVCTTVVAGVATASWAADSLSPSQALAQGLTFSPVQSHVEYTIPSKEEAAECTIQPEKETKGTAWVVRNGRNQILRRFADTNNDNVVDLWCYYLDGIEVYRDIDSNFNKKAEQYRWFNTAGTRWGIDRNEDGRIDSWQTISPHEVAEQVVIAIKTRDRDRFNLLLATPNELNDLGLGKQRVDQLTSTVRTAGERFGTLTSEQKVVTAESRYIDFGSARPATIPTGTAGSTSDVTVCDNATALIQTAAKHEQVFLGTLVQVGDTWKVVDVPAIGANNQPAVGFVQPGGPAGAEVVAADGPTQEMQKLLDELERLDAQADNLSGDAQAKNIGDRADRLEKLAEIAPDKKLSEQFYSQLADMLSVAVQMDTYPKAGERLSELEEKLADAQVDEQVLAHVAFQHMWAKYVASQNQPGANGAQIQQQWLTDLQAFVEKYPSSNDTAEALLQLGMYQEFVGETEQAGKWYQQLVSKFPNAGQAAKARGALMRLTSVGKPIRLRGPDFNNGTVDIAAPAYRGKAVVVHYWATWSDNCKNDMVLLKNLYATQGGGRDFEIVGVCLDAEAAAAKQFLNENRFPWKHMYDSGGIDGKLANEMGVMTLPLMLLVDRDGKVIRNNIQAAELGAELTRLQKPPGEQANNNSLRRGTAPR